MIDLGQVAKEIREEIEKLDKKQSNADKIRAMNDEELAVIIMCPHDVPEPLPQTCSEQSCVECTMN